jgi:hypothetical protein
MEAGRTPVAAVPAVATAAAVLVVAAVATTIRGGGPRVKAVRAAPWVWQAAAEAAALQMASVVTEAMPAVPVRTVVAVYRTARVEWPVAVRRPEPAGGPVTVVQKMRAVPAAEAAGCTAPLI